MTSTQNPPSDARKRELLDLIARAKKYGQDGFVRLYEAELRALR